MSALEPSTLHLPAHHVSPAAVRMWRMTSWATVVVTTAIAAALWLFLPDWPWWAWLITAVAILPEVATAIWMPRIRYQNHRWEVTPEAVHTRTGWLTTELRIAPLNRVQTVDSVQGPVMRLFGLASVTVTTASAAGPLSIEGLDREVAHRVVAELTSITAASEGDAT